MLILGAALAVFFFFAFLYKSTPPAFMDRLLWLFDERRNLPPRIDEAGIHFFGWMPEDVQQRWRGFVIGLGAFVFVVAILVWLFIFPVPPDPEDMCTWRLCP